MKILLTSTSFQDTPGKHHEILNSTDHQVDHLRGPLTEEELLLVIDKYDGVICGDDEYNKRVLTHAAKFGKLKVISKYGIGLDKIDLNTAKKLGVTVFNTPGVNDNAVAEHCFALLLSFEKNIIKEHLLTQKAKWSRLIGNEIYGKSIGILGMGSVGKQVAKRANAFGMNIFGFDKVEDPAFNSLYNIKFCNNLEKMVNKIDYLSLNLPLNNHTRNIISKNIFDIMREDVVIINTARAELVDLDSLIINLEQKKVRGYLTDVLEVEPMKKNHRLLNFENVIITPHIGSRNYQTVERQGTFAVKNILNFFKNR